MSKTPIQYSNETTDQKVLTHLLDIPESYVSSRKELLESIRVFNKTSLKKAPKNKNQKIDLKKLEIGSPFDFKHINHVSLNDNSAFDVRFKIKQNFVTNFYFFFLHIENGRAKYGSAEMKQIIIFFFKFATICFFID